jgi:NADH:ubiquinone oxidoreductase subunit K
LSINTYNRSSAILTRRGIVITHNRVVTVNISAPNIEFLSYLIAKITLSVAAGEAAINMAVILTVWLIGSQTYNRRDIKGINKSLKKAI